MDLGNGQTEEVPIYAAGCNMMGALAYKDKDMVQAKDWYQKAITSFPSFIIAAENMKGLTEEQQPKTPASKPTQARTKQ